MDGGGAPRHGDKNDKPSGLRHWAQKKVVAFKPPNSSIPQRNQDAYRT